MKQCCVPSPLSTLHFYSYFRSCWTFKVEHIEEHSGHSPVMQTHFQIQDLIWSCSFQQCFTKQTTVLCPNCTETLIPNTVESWKVEAGSLQTTVKCIKQSTHNTERWQASDRTVGHKQQDSSVGVCGKDEHSLSNNRVQLSPGRQRADRD